MIRILCADDKNEQNFRTMGRLITFTILATLTACASQKEKANQYFDSNRGELAEKCEKEFPNDTIKIIKGVEVIKHDTIKLPGVVIECPEPDKPGKPVYVKCPESKTITVIRERTDTIVITDTQKTKAIEHKLKTSTDNLNEITAKYNRAQKTKQTYLWALIIAAGLVITSILLRNR